MINKTKEKQELSPEKDGKRTLIKSQIKKESSFFEINSIEKAIILASNVYENAERKNLAFNLFACYMVFGHTMYSFVNDMRKGVIPNDRETVTIKDKVDYLLNYADFFNLAGDAYIEYFIEGDLFLGFELITFDKNKMDFQTEPGYYYDKIVHRPQELSHIIGNILATHNILYSFFSDIIEMLEKGISDENVWKKVESKFAELKIFAPKGM